MRSLKDKLKDTIKMRLVSRGLIWKNSHKTTHTARPLQEVTMLDKEGYRLNVGIVLVNAENRLFWGKRIGQDAWQFPQGGVHAYETLEETMYRELYEEVGLAKDDVELLAVTRRWLHYRLPKRFLRRRQKPLCVGQKQKWYLLRLTSDESKIDFTASGSPEFDGYEWVDYWSPIESVIDFKREVYTSMLKEFEPILF